MVVARGAFKLYSRLGFGLGGGQSGQYRIGWQAYGMFYECILGTAWYEEPLP